MTLAVHHIPADRNGAARHDKSGQPGTARSLVLTHGFTQNAHCWGSFADHLAHHHHLTLVDAPGHGHSGHDNAGLWEAGRLLAEAGTGIHVGYSMGGRMALHAALSSPTAVQGLVLIGATAGIDNATERAQRRQADERLADRLERDGVAAFLDFWLDLPLFAGLDDAASARNERLTNRARGLAASLRHCGTGSQEPLWDRLGQLSVPVLVLAGDRDHKFTAIGRRLADTVNRGGGTATFRPVPGTHAVHLEAPEATAGAVLEWLGHTSTAVSG